MIKVENHTAILLLKAAIVIKTDGNLNCFQIKALKCGWELRGLSDARLQNV